MQDLGSLRGQTQHHGLVRGQEYIVEFKNLIENESIAVINLPKNMWLVNRVQTIHSDELGIYKWPYLY